MKKLLLLALLVTSLFATTKIIKDNKIIELKQGDKFTINNKSEVFIYQYNQLNELYFSYDKKYIQPNKKKLDIKSIKQITIYHKKSIIPYMLIGAFIATSNIYYKQPLILRVVDHLKNKPYKLIVTLSGMLGGVVVGSAINDKWRNKISYNISENEWKIVSN